MATTITKRLSRDNNYNNKKQSYQDSLSPDEIKKKLEEYKQVDDIALIPLNTHLRYFTINPENNEKQFRLGGFLTKLDEKYVILANGKLSWSVQVKNTIFFQKMTFTELKTELTLKISKQFDKQLEQLKDENKKMKNILKQVKKEVKKK